MKKSYRHIPIVARMLAGTFGVEVVFQAIDTAATDGKKIFLPNHAVLGTDEDVALLEGLIDHEAGGHCAQTDFSVLTHITCPVTASIQNVLEDIRIERNLYRRMPGCLRNMCEALRILASRDKWGMAPQQESTAVQLLIPALVHHLRSQELQMEDWTSIAGQYSDIMLSKVGAELWNKTIDLATSGSRTDNTQGTVDYAKQIVELFQIASQQQQSEQQQQQQQQQQNENQVGDNQQGDQHGSTGKSSRPDSGDPTQQPNSSGQAGEPSSEDIANFASAILSCDPDEIPSSEIADSLSSEIMSDSKRFMNESGQRQVATNFEQHQRSIQSFWDVALLRNRAQLVVGRLDNRLESLLESLTESSEHLARSGRLSRNHVAHAMCGNSRIFMKSDEADALDTAIGIVKDDSSSMQDMFGTFTKAEAATLASFALGEVLNRFEVPFTITNFDSSLFDITASGSWKNDRSRFPLHPSGSTNTHLGLEHAVRSVQAFEQSRKLLVLITDGQPNDVPSLSLVLSEIRRHGVDVVCLAIGNEFKSDFRALFTNKLSVANAPGQLAQAMFEAIQSAF